jgi:excisionase family DNA binding protein
MAAARRRLVTMKQIAEDYSLSPRTIRMWVATGRLTGYLVGGRSVRLDPDEVETAMVSRRIPSARVS